MDKWNIKFIEAKTLLGVGYYYQVWKCMGDFQELFYGEIERLDNSWCYCASGESYFEESELREVADFLTKLNDAQILEGK